MCPPLLTVACEIAEARDAVLPSPFQSWREQARELLRRDVPPHLAAWRDRKNVQATFGYAEDARSISVRDPALPIERSQTMIGSHKREVRGVPSSFLKLAESVMCHSDAARWDALYRVLWRLTHGESSLLDVATDPDVHRLSIMDRAVRRAVHKMHAFVRFRAVEHPSPSLEFSAADSRTYIAWFEPSHPVVQRASGFFVRRFASMRWSILTPDECAHWDGSALRFSDGVSRATAPSEDELEDLWRSYYANTFNPARVSTSAMQAEMPKSYWRNLPEAALIGSLTRDAPARVRRMLSQLNSPSETMPLALQSRVGDASVPLRDGPAVALQFRSDLDTAGAWDQIHDPGVTVAQLRAKNVCLPTDQRLNELRDACALRVGTASWTDPTILQRGVFYPPDAITAEARLRYYATRFSMVEVDSTYYVPPTRSTVQSWCQNTPDDFVFDIKAFALMTGHPAELKRLPDWLRRLVPPSCRNKLRLYATDLPANVIDEVWTRFQAALTPLREAGKLGPILLQYPRWFVPSRASADELRLARERFGDHAAAVEFRNPDWVTGRIAERTFALLERLDLTYVIVDAPQGTASSMPPVVRVTTPGFALLRLHGRRAETWEAKHSVVSERYRYLYDHEQLAQWATRIDDLDRQIRTSWDTAPSVAFPDMAKAKQGVHVVFNNCHANYGTTNADEITALLRKFDRYRLRA